MGDKLQALEVRLKELTREMNRQYAFQSKVLTSLPDILSLYTKKELYHLATAYEIAGRSKMNKEELVRAVAAACCEPGNMKRNLLRLDKEQWAFFMRVLRAECLVDDEVHPRDYMEASLYGLIFNFYHGGEVTYIVPAEIKDAVSCIDLDQLKVIHDRYQLVIQYVKALVNLYGAYLPDQLIEIFNSQNEEPLTEEELFSILDLYLQATQKFDMLGPYIVDVYYTSGEPKEQEKFHELLERTEGKPYYVPERDELLKYASDDYYEITPQLKALKAYVLKHLHGDEQMVDALIDDIQFRCWMEAPLQEIFWEFERRKIYFDYEKQIREIVPLIIDVYNHTRLRSNRGYTPNELSKITGRGTLYNSGIPMDIQHRGKVVPLRRSGSKIGRNDPCPCGSGKKYKKCCGR